MPAVAPVVTIESPGAVINELSGSITLRAALAGGTYTGSPTWAWSVESGIGRIFDFGSGVAFYAISNLIAPVDTDPVTIRGTVTVSDTDGTTASAYAEVSFTVNRAVRPPVVRIDTPAQTINGRATLQLNATATDVQGFVVGHKWTAMRVGDTAMADVGGFSNAATQNPLWTAPQPDTESEYLLTYTATDDDGDTASATVVITVRAGLTPDSLPVAFDLRELTLRPNPLAPDALPAAFDLAEPYLRPNPLAPDTLPVVLDLAEPYLRPNPLRPDALPVAFDLAGELTPNVLFPTDTLAVAFDLAELTIRPNPLRPDALPVVLDLAEPYLRPNPLRPDALPVVLDLAEPYLRPNPLRPDALPVAFDLAGELAVGVLYLAEGIGVAFDLGEPRIVGGLLIPDDAIAVAPGLAARRIAQVLKPDALPVGFDIRAAQLIGSLLRPEDSLAVRFDLGGALPTTTIPAAAAGEVRGLQGRAQVFALEIWHPEIADPVRVVADRTEDIETFRAPYTIEGQAYVCVGFRAVPPQDKEGEVRAAQLEIDNVGRVLMEWVEASDGGRGAVMRMMRVAPPAGGEANDAAITWEVTLPVVLSEITNERVRVGISEDPLFGRPAVIMRHDPTTSPGLF